MHSLFEEQIVREQLSTFLHTERHGESFAEAMTYFRAPTASRSDRGVPRAHRPGEGGSALPVIASLNGTTLGGWLDYAKAMQQAGADALELNVYSLHSDPEEAGPTIEDRTVEMLKPSRRRSGSPWRSAVALLHVDGQLRQAPRRRRRRRPRALQPLLPADIDAEALQAVRALHLSNSSELPLRLRWLAILSGRVKASLAVTGGVHTPSTRSSR